MTEKAGGSGSLSGLGYGPLNKALIGNVMRSPSVDLLDFSLAEILTIAD